MYRSDSDERPPNPILKSWLISRLLFLWTKDIFRIGMTRGIEEHDIYATLQEHESEHIGNWFRKLWNDELKRKKPSIIRMFWKSYGISVMTIGQLFAFSETIARIFQPLFVGGLVSYFAPGQTEISRETAYLYATGIAGSTLYQVLSFHPFIFYMIQAGLKLKVASCTLIYQKVLRLSKSTTFDGMNGQVINLMSNDVMKFELALVFFHDLWKGPMEIVIIGYLIYCEIGTIPTLIGMLFLLTFIPLQGWIGKMTATYRLKTAKRTDIRVRFMNEIIQGMQVIKMYTWERSFAEMVDKVRRQEMNAIRGTSYIRAALFSFFVVSRVSIFLSLIAYVYLGNIITPRKVFVIAGYFVTLDFSMVFCWPQAIQAVTEAYVSIKRIEKFLLHPERKESADDIDFNDDDKRGKNKHKNKKAKGNVTNKEKLKNNLNDGESASLQPQTRIENIDAKDKSVILKSATAVWSHKEKNIGIFSINLEVIPKKLCAVIGAVGCGKTTLLNVIIGELELDTGTININGVLSYAAQEPWLFEGTVRQNIVFIEQYDENRYREVCRVCALERDFELLPFADLTIVGERGSVLSGGQKARVSLARAVYKRADIYLLDEPLGAVDTKVGKQLFTECIQGFLSDKCVILVTHQLQYLKNLEHIVLMQNGRIDVQGSFDEIKKLRAHSILELTMHDEAGEEDQENEEKEFERMRSFKSIEIEEEEDKETLMKGNISLSVYGKYVKAVKSMTMVVFVGLSFIITQAIMSGIDVFVAQWADWEENMGAKQISVLSPFSIIRTFQNMSSIELDLYSINNSKQSTNESVVKNISSPISIFLPSTFKLTVIGVREQYVLVYCGLTILLVYFAIHRSFVFYNMCLRASINLHDRLFRGITRAPMLFFNNNPSGRILNRFSKDIGSIDSFLPQHLIETLSCFLEMFAIGILVSIFNPWLIIPTALLGCILYFMRQFYMKTAREINRIESTTRSPLYAHTNATIQGLSTIRVFKAESILNDEFNKYHNKNTGPMYLFLATSRAFAIWLDIFCAIYIVAVTYSFFIIDTNYSGGDVGLIIVQAISLVGMSQYGIRESADLENKMVSVERISEYTNLPPEPALETLPEYAPPHGWPQYGAIRFNNLSLKYSPDGKFVLHELNFSINPGEKLGIVGRTGAGKSSIVQALFRLAELDGNIEIDGINTNTLGLHDLRNKIAIIPQDPILFSGTMRNNLDPFEEKTDDEMWSALEEVELKQTVLLLSGGLDCKMSDGGNNFSMGQRQLVCLARAILRNNKILILDEATANVDPETDKLIQTTIRTKFAECTVITIAHRLQTVMDSDRVLVMDAGKAVEFAAPHELLQTPGGHLRKLVDQTGTATANVLKKVAKESYEKKASTSAK